MSQRSDHLQLSPFKHESSICTRLQPSYSRDKPSEMPRPTQLPTPQSSIQPAAKDGGHELEQIDMLLELPPSVFESTRSGPSSPLISSYSDEERYPEYTPVSPITRASTTKKRKSRSNKENITLPPPPSRARKIIEMKPKPSQSTSSPSASPEPTKRSKKPAQSSTSRKISRKTAHSLIERRRRGKMNDEFEVLKDMIPACKASEDGGTGREMHKLEILKASVEYIRYLKDCVCKLQGDGVACCAPQEVNDDMMVEGKEDAVSMDEDTDIEIEMEHATPECQTGTQTPSRPAELQSEKEIPIDPQLMHFHPPPTPKLSPAILPQVDRNLSIDSVTSPITIPARQHTASSTTSHGASSSLEEGHFSFSSSNSYTSPPQNQFNTFTWRASISSQTSPMMAPLPSQENDATVALLMLNGEWPSRGHMGRAGSRDERATKGFVDGPRMGERRRGLSVKELLSS